MDTGSIETSDRSYTDYFAPVEAYTRNSLLDIWGNRIDICDFSNIHALSKFLSRYFWFPSRDPKSRGVKSLKEQLEVINQAVEGEFNHAEIDCKLPILFMGYLVKILLGVSPDDMILSWRSSGAHPHLLIRSGINNWVISVDFLPEMHFSCDYLCSRDGKLFWSEVSEWLALQDVKSALVDNIGFANLDEYYCHVYEL